MNGKWQGSGTWQTSGGAAKPLIAVVAVVALVSYLATVLLLLAIVLAVVVVAGAGCLLLLWRLSRPNDQDQRLLAERWAAMHQGIARQAVALPVPPEIHFHGGTHLHVGPGTDPAVIRQAIPLGVTEEE